MITRVILLADFVALLLMATPGAQIAKQVERSHPIGEDVASSSSTFIFKEGRIHGSSSAVCPSPPMDSSKRATSSRRGTRRSRSSSRNCPAEPSWSVYGLFRLCIDAEGKSGQLEWRIRDAYGAPPFSLIVATEPHIAVRSRRGMQSRLQAQPAPRSSPANSSRWHE